MQPDFDGEENEVGWLVIKSLVVFLYIYWLCDIRYIYIIDIRYDFDGEENEIGWLVIKF